MNSLQVPLSFIDIILHKAFPYEDAFNWYEIFLLIISSNVYKLFDEAFGRPVLALDTIVHSRTATVSPKLWSLQRERNNLNDS